MQRSTDLESAVREIVDAMRMRDSATVERMLSRSDGAVIIGSDPSEYTRDIDEVLQMMRESTPDQSGYTVRLGEIAGYDEGHVGWFDGTFHFERERESVESRLTGVAHKENGQWRFVQMHVSIGVPNERIFEPMFRGQAAASSAGYQA